MDHLLRSTIGLPLSILSSVLIIIWSSTSSLQIPLFSTTTYSKDFQQDANALTPKLYKEVKLELDKQLVSLFFRAINPNNWYIHLSTLFLFCHVYWASTIDTFVQTLTMRQEGRKDIAYHNSGSSTILWITSPILFAYKSWCFFSSIEFLISLRFDNSLPLLALSAIVFVIFPVIVSIGAFMLFKLVGKMILCSLKNIDCNCLISFGINLKINLGESVSGLFS